MPSIARPGTEVTELLAPRVSVESRRRIVGFARLDVPSSQWPEDMRRYLETGMVRYHQTALAVRGDGLALFRLELGTTDRSSGAPQDEELHVVGLDENRRIALQVKFDVEDIDAATRRTRRAHTPLAGSPRSSWTTPARGRCGRVVVCRRTRSMGRAREAATRRTDSRVDERSSALPTRTCRPATCEPCSKNSASRLRHEIIAVRGERFAPGSIGSWDRGREPRRTARRDTSPDRSR